MRALLALALFALGALLIQAFYPGMNTCSRTKYYITFVAETFPKRCKGPDCDKQFKELSKMVMKTAEGSPCE